MPPCSSRKTPSSTQANGVTHKLSISRRKIAKNPLIVANACRLHRLERAREFYKEIGRSGVRERARPWGSRCRLRARRDVARRRVALRALGAANPKIPAFRASDLPPKISPLVRALGAANDQCSLPISRSLCEKISRSTARCAAKAGSRGAFLGEIFVACQLGEDLLESGRFGGNTGDAEARAQQRSDEALGDGQRRFAFGEGEAQLCVAVGHERHAVFRRDAGDARLLPQKSRRAPL